MHREKIRYEKLSDGRLGRVVFISSDGKTLGIQVTERGKHVVYLVRMDPKPLGKQ